MASAMEDLQFIFPVADCHRLSDDAELYCLVTEAHVCEQLAQRRYVN